MQRLRVDVGDVVAIRKDLGCSLSRAKLIAKQRMMLEMLEDTSRLTMPDLVLIIKEVVRNLK